MLEVRNTERRGLPLVSIGMPVYNGVDVLGCAIESVLSQSFRNFELIISDNASTDGTEALCRGFAANDSRIRYIRQSANLGAIGNFRFVLDEACGRYFMWAAADDLRSPDFLAENVGFLNAHPEYVASTCPNCFEGEEGQADRIVDFAISGGVEERYLSFLRHCWQSHGIFYSLMRTSIIRECEIPGQSFTAADWAIDFFLASRGGINRTAAGLAVFGRGGVSSSAGSWRAFRERRIELVLPFYRFSRYALGLMKPLPWRNWWRVFFVLVRLNMSASFDQTRATLYEFYCRHFKSV
mgnify:CR=1 FL=1